MGTWDLAHLHPPKACPAYQLTRLFGAGNRDVQQRAQGSLTLLSQPPTPPRTRLRKHDALRAEHADGAEGAHKVKVVDMGRDAVALWGRKVREQMQGEGRGGAGASQLVTWMDTVRSQALRRERSSRAEPMGAPELPAAASRADDQQHATCACVRDAALAEACVSIHAQTTTAELTAS